MIITVKLLSIWLINWINSVYNCEHIDYLAMSAQSIILSMSIIWQHQLVFSCLIFINLNFSFIQFFLIQIFLLIFLLFFCLTNLILTFEIFDQIYYYKQLFCFVLYFFWKVSYLLCFLSCFVSLFEISVKLTAISCYLILCSILRKDLLFALSNFRNANFSNVYI